MADDIITPTEEEKRQEQYVSPYESPLQDIWNEMEQQRADDTERIEKLSKGRAYWVGANMFANALGNLINVYGTTHGAPAMKMPDMDNSYMKLWKESDDIRRANYQRMKDRYDRLRLAKIQDEASWNRELNRRDWQEQQTKETRTYNEGLAEAERKRKEQEREDLITNIMSTHPGYTREDAIALINDKSYVPEKDKNTTVDAWLKRYPTVDRNDIYNWLYRNGPVPEAIAKDEEDRKKREYSWRVNGREKDYDINIGGVIIGALRQNEFDANIGNINSIVKRYIDKVLPNPGDFPDSKIYGTGTEGYQKWSEAKKKYDDFQKKYGNRSLSKAELEELVRTYGLDKDKDFMREINALAGKGTQQAPAGNEDPNSFFD